VVEWPDAPSLRNGEIFISRGVLRVILEKFPDFALPDALPVPTLAEGIASASGVVDTSGEGPEQPPGLEVSWDGSTSIKRIVLVLVPGSGLIANSTPTVTPQLELFAEEFKTVMSERKITANQILWNPAKPGGTNRGADLLLAVEIRSASPVPTTAFLFYEAGTAGGDSGSGGLIDWNQANKSYQKESRTFAEKLTTSYQGVYGKEKTLGVRGGPFRVLQGRMLPAVLVSLGVPQGKSDEDIRQSARLIAASLAGGSVE
jgi:N-acetylmuramoyl-L-alanine amidase